jgi:hypothetical protein
MCTERRVEWTSAAFQGEGKRDSKSLCLQTSLRNHHHRLLLTPPWTFHSESNSLITLSEPVIDFVAFSVRFNSAEQAHMSKIIEKKQVSFPPVPFYSARSAYGKGNCWS